MFFRTPRFIRRWLRARMHPMAENNAWSVKQKLSIAYMLIAWNCFGYVCYQMANGNKHWPVTHGLITEEEMDLSRPAYGWAKTLGINKAEVYRVSGISIKGKDSINLEDKEKSSTKNNSDSELS